MPVTKSAGLCLFVLHFVKFIALERCVCATKVLLVFLKCLLRDCVSNMCVLFDSLLKH